jgi:hypothetical protein
MMSLAREAAGNESASHALLAPDVWPDREGKDEALILQSQWACHKHALTVPSWKL